MKMIQMLGDQAWAFIAWLTRWRPASRIKLLLEWIGVLATAFLGTWQSVDAIMGSYPLKYVRSVAGLEALGDDADPVLRKVGKRTEVRLAATTTYGYDPAITIDYLGDAPMQIYADIKDPLHLILEEVHATKEPCLKSFASKLDRRKRACLPLTTTIRRLAPNEVLISTGLKI